MKYPAAFILAALLFCACSDKEQQPAPPAQTPALSSAAAPEYPEITVTQEAPGKPDCGLKKGFTGPKGESAPEYLLGIRLRPEENASWAGDKRVCRYHSYLAEKLHEAKEASVSCGRESELFFGTTKSGNIDLDKLSGMQAVCAKETAVYKAISGKLEKGAPNAYYRSNAAMRSDAATAYKAASARDGEFEALLTDWRNITASGATASFPMEAARSIMKKPLSPRLENGQWKKLFLEDSERYFDRSIHHGG